MTPAHHPPAAGGWAPRRKTPIVVALLAGVCSSTGTFLMSGSALTVGAVIGSALVGLATGAAGYFGIKSAGPRQVRK